jgi:hypothetical protein
MGDERVFRGRREADGSDESDQEDESDEGDKRTAFSDPYCQSRSPVARILLTPWFSKLFHALDPSEVF